MRRYLGLLLVCLSAHPENLITIESKLDRRAYLIDVDSLAIRHKLYSVAGVNTAVPSVPAWLLPYPGAQPSNVFRSALNGESIAADFQTGGNYRQVSDYYAALLPSRGFPIKLRSDTIPGQITLHADNGTERAVVRASERNGAVQLHINYGIRRQGVIGGAVPKMNLVASTYDDANGVLRLTDQLTGRQFYLRKRTIANEDYNRLEEHQKTLSRFPEWLTFYPGAAVRQSVRPCKRKLGDRPSLCATIETAAHPNRIWDYYEALVKQQGFSFYSSGTNVGILANEILTVKVDVFHRERREYVLIQGDRFATRNLVIRIQWSQLPPFLDIPDPDEQTFEDRVRRHRQIR